MVVDVLSLAAFDHQVGDDGVDAKVQLLDSLFTVFGPEILSNGLFKNHLSPVRLVRKTLARKL